MIPLLDASADVMTPRGRILSQQTVRKGKANVLKVTEKARMRRAEPNCDALDKLSEPQSTKKHYPSGVVR